MSQLTIEFDTVTKQGSVKMDGVDVTDASEVALYRYGGEEWGLRVESYTHDKDNSMSTRTTIYAHEEPTPPAETAPEQVTADVVKDVHKFFGIQD